MRWRIIDAIRRLLGATAQPPAARSPAKRAMTNTERSDKLRAERAAAGLTTRGRPRKQPPARNECATLHVVARNVAPSLSYRELEKEKGTRISDDWQPDDEGRRLGVEVFGDKVDIEIRRHRDFWLGIPSPRGLRVDWQAVWRAHVERRREEQFQLAFPKLVSSNKARSDRAAGAGVLIKPDTPEWQAWCEHLGKAPVVGGRSGGWYAPSQFPPAPPKAADG